MAQHTLGREEARILVEDAAHVLVGRYQTLHQHVGTAVDHSLHGEVDTCHIARLVDDAEDIDVDLQLAAGLLDRGLVAKERRLDQTVLPCVVDSLDRVRILTVGYGETLASPCRCGRYQFFKMLYHDVCVFGFRVVVI